MPRILFLFLDGVGIGSDDPEANPFLQARLPVLRGLLDGGLPTRARPRVDGRGGVAFPLNAHLDTAGTPQSGTGQVSLLTGRNAAHFFGRHFGPWTPVRLRPFLLEENLLARAAAEGHCVLFANAYPREYMAHTPSRLMAAPPLAAHSAGLLVRHEDELARGEAVASEIVNTGWRRELGFRRVPELTAEEAGKNLARVALQGDLTLFAHYGTDYAGHRGGRTGAIAALERVDRFLSGLLEALDRNTLVLIASDHGNVEELGRGHTRNPALGLAVGRGAAELSQDLRSITDVTPALLRALRGG